MHGRHRRCFNNSNDIVTAPLHLCALPSITMQQHMRATAVVLANRPQQYITTHLMPTQLPT